MRVPLSTGEGEQVDRVPFHIYRNDAGALGGIDDEEGSGLPRQGAHVAQGCHGSSDVGGMIDDEKTRPGGEGAFQGREVGPAGGIARNNLEENTTAPGKVP